GWSGNATRTTPPPDAPPSDMALFLKESFASTASSKGATETPPGTRSRTASGRCVGQLSRPGSLRTTSTHPAGRGDRWPTFAREYTLPAVARVIDDETERREVLPHIARVWKRNDLDRMVRYSPLIEVKFD